MKTLRERCTAIELLLVDVDGVLTAGGIVYGSPELEIKQFHVRDGAGLKAWHRAGKRSGIVTGRSSPLVGAGRPSWASASWCREQQTKGRPIGACWPRPA